MPLKAGIRSAQAKVEIAFLQCICRLPLASGVGGGHLKGAEPSTVPHPSSCRVSYLVCWLWETCIMGTCLLACTPVVLSSFPFEDGISTFLFSSVVAA